MAGYYNQGSNIPPPAGYGYQQGPPPQAGQFPPHQGFGGPPPMQQGGYQQMPPQGFPPGPPPPQQYGGGPPPPGQFPGGPQQNFGPPPMPSLGYDPRVQAQGDASLDADALRKAMKGFGTDEATLIRVLSKPDPLQINLLRTTYNQRHRRDLLKDVKSETSGYFCETLEALIRGPLIQDAHNIHRAVSGPGTKEVLMNDVLLGRTNADMRAIHQAYHQAFNRSMEKDVSDDLSLKTKELFQMVLAGNRTEENVPIYPQNIDRDVHDLYSAMRGMGTDQTTVSRILSHASDGQIRAIAQQFEQRYQTTLVKKLSGDFSGHMRDALVLMVERACDRAMTDAVQLEETMAGPGTKDILLVNRVVRVHWNRAHADQVKRAYQHRYKRDLLARIRGDTSGDYEKLLVACLS